MEYHISKEKIYEFYDGELTESESRRIESHLAVCRECKLEFELLKEASRLFFEKSEAIVPPGFSEKVMQRILEKEEKREKIYRGSVFDLFGLPRWEVLTAYSVSFLIFCYFTIHAVKTKEQAAKNPVELIFNQEETDSLIYSNQEINKESLLPMFYESESNSEESLYDE